MQPITSVLEKMSPWLEVVARLLHGGGVLAVHLQDAGVEVEVEVEAE